MTVKDTNYYMDLGREHAADPSAPTPFKRESTSWQARAYWSGYHGKLMPAKPAGVKAPTERELTADQERIAHTCKVAAELVASGAVLNVTATGRISSALPQPHNGHQSIDGWPDAPRSHYLELARQLNSETDQRRRERLQRSMERMYERWSSKSIRLL